MQYSTTRELCKRKVVDGLNTKRDYLEQADQLLILHGTKDEIVPFEAVKAVAEDNVIEFEPIEGADHCFMDQKKMDLTIFLIIAFSGLK